MISEAELRQAVAETLSNIYNAWCFNGSKYPWCVIMGLPLFEVVWERFVPNRYKQLPAKDQEILRKAIVRALVEVAERHLPSVLSSGAELEEVVRNL